MQIELPLSWSSDLANIAMGNLSHVCIVREAEFASEYTKCIEIYEYIIFKVIICFVMYCYFNKVCIENITCLIDTHRSLEFIRSIIYGFQS